KVARDKGASLPAGSVVNSAGDPTTRPEDYYADPPGAVLPFGGHKGAALSMFCEVFAGILSGGSCSGPGDARVANGFFALYVDPAAFCEPAACRSQVGALVSWVKSSKTMSGHAEVFLAGEPE